MPKQFSWIDHRLVRENYLDGLSHSAAALYLFLVTVGDREGLSYYSDKSICVRLSMQANGLKNVRNELIRKNLIAYKRPIYQVLDLNFEKAERRMAKREPHSIGEILKIAAGGTYDRL